MKVPTCPLCNQPVPTARGEDPNIKVNQHIQQDCRSDKAKKVIAHEGQLYIVVCSNYLSCTWQNCNCGLYIA